MKKKRVVTILMIFAILFTSIPMTNINNLKVSAATTESLSKEQITKVLKTVKTKITIPNDYTIFGYDLSEDNATSTTTIIFTWWNESYDKLIQIACNQDGDISYYNKSDYTKDNEIPKYLKAELKDKADAFIKKMSPNIVDHLQFVDGYYSSIHEGYFTYSYVRVENGILMPQQTVTVGVNSVTGEVVNYDSNWLYNLTIPKSDIKITKEEAQAIIGSNVEMNLAYYSKLITDDKGNNTMTAYLAYRPSSSYLAVDAKTGEVYTTQSQWITTNQNESTEEEDQDSSTGGGQNILTDKEIAEISKLKNMISKKKAINIIKDNEYLYLDKNATLITATLREETTESWSKDSKRYVWFITFRDPRPVESTSDDSYRGFASASVDAITGEIISYITSSEVIQTYGSKKVSFDKAYTKKESRTLFEKFAKSQNKKRFNTTELSKAEQDFLLYKKGDQNIYGGYSFLYNRVQEGIPYADNYIYGSVDSVTGKIVSYGYSWYNNITFESSKNAMDAKKAFDSFINYDGFELLYEINTKNQIVMSEKNKESYVSDYKISYEVRLVYQMSINPDLVSPFTGKQLNWNGDEYKKEVTYYEYKDISGHKSERSIKLLANMGIGFEGENYYPDQAITKDELQILFRKLYYYYLADNISGSNTITRADAAKFVISNLGLSYVAQAKDIFKLDFADASEVTDAMAGYVALAEGLDILSCNEENKFRPMADLTRGEAADMVLKLLGYLYK